MIEFIDPNSNKLVSSGPTMARKAYYIHGTTSDNDRWSNYPSTVQQLNLCRMIIFLLRLVLSP